MAGNGSALGRWYLYDGKGSDSKDAGHNQYVAAYGQGIVKPSVAEGDYKLYGR